MGDFRSFRVIFASKYCFGPFPMRPVSKFSIFFFGPQNSKFCPGTAIFGRMAHFWAKGRSKKSGKNHFFFRKFRIFTPPVKGCQYLEAIFPDFRAFFAIFRDFRAFWGRNRRGKAGLGARVAGTPSGGEITAPGRPWRDFGGQKVEKTWFFEVLHRKMMIFPVLTCF